MLRHWVTLRDTINLLRVLLCAQPLVEFLTQKGIRIKNVEKTNASRASGLQEAEIPTDEDDDDYGAEESETGIYFSFFCGYLPLADLLSTHGVRLVSPLQWGTLTENSSQESSRQSICFRDISSTEGEFGMALQTKILKTKKMMMMPAKRVLPSRMRKGRRKRSARKNIR